MRILPPHLRKNDFMTEAPFRYRKRVTVIILPYAEMVSAATGKRYGGKRKESGLFRICGHDGPVFFTDRLNSVPDFPRADKDHQNARK